MENMKDFRGCFLLCLVLLFSAVEASGIYEIMPGHYKLELLATDSEESYPVVLEFSAGDATGLVDGRISYPTYDCESVIIKSSNNQYIINFNEKITQGDGVCVESKYRLEINEGLLFEPHKKKYLKVSSFNEDEKTVMIVQGYKYTATKYAQYRILKKIYSSTEYYSTTDSNKVRKFLELVGPGSKKLEAQDYLGQLMRTESREYQLIKYSENIEELEKYKDNYRGAVEIKKINKRITRIKNKKKIESYRKKGTPEALYFSYKLSGDDQDIVGILQYMSSIDKLNAFLITRSDLVSNKLIIKRYVELYRAEETADSYYKAYMLSKDIDDVHRLLACIVNLAEFEKFLSNKSELKKLIVVNKKLADFYRKHDTFDGYVKSYELLGDESDLYNILSLSDSINKLEWFIATYRENNKYVNDAKDKLTAKYREEGSYSSYLSAFLLTGHDEDAKKALHMSTTPSQQATIEKYIFEKYNKLAFFINYNIESLAPIYTDSEMIGSMFTMYRLSGVIQPKVRVKVSWKDNVPFKPKYGIYEIVFNLKVNIPRVKSVRSRILGNKDIEDSVVRKKTIKLTLNYPYDETIKELEFGKLSFAYFDRGVSGGYTAISPTGDVSLLVEDIQITHVGSKVSDDRKFSINFDKITTFKAHAIHKKINILGSGDAGLSMMERFSRLDAAKSKSTSSVILADADDMKNWCLAASGKYPDFCYSIKSSDLKNTCLGMTGHPDICYTVGNEDIKNMCLARTEYPENCHLIENKDILSACLGITQDKDICYSSHGHFQALCIGITMRPDECYNIH
jgi:hypothetical protein